MVRGRWTRLPYSPHAPCNCAWRHAPPLMVVETHHIVPLSWGGTDTDDNKVRLCPSTHYSTHALLNEYVRANGRPVRSVLRRYTQVCQVLAAMAWRLRDTGHPTPYWMSDHATTHNPSRATVANFDLATGEPIIDRLTD